MFTAVCENESEISFLITRVAAGSVCDWVSYEGVIAQRFRWKNYVRWLLRGLEFFCYKRIIEEFRMIFLLFVVALALYMRVQSITLY